MWVCAVCAHSLPSINEFVEILAREDVPLLCLCRNRNPNGMQPARLAIWAVSQAFGAVRIAGSVRHREAVRGVNRDCSAPRGAPPRSCSRPNSFHRAVASSRKQVQTRMIVPDVRL